ncbi:MAG: hypothetical protein WCD62_06940, partial [Pseudolabrys sp.]
VLKRDIYDDHARTRAFAKQKPPPCVMETSTVVIALAHRIRPISKLSEVTRLQVCHAAVDILVVFIVPWSNSPAVDPLRKFSLGTARDRNAPMNAAF